MEERRKKEGTRRNKQDRRRNVRDNGDAHDRGPRRAIKGLARSEMVKGRKGKRSHEGDTTIQMFV